MISFQTTKNVAAKIGDIIRRAEEHIVLVSPYLQISDRYLNRLKRADRQGVEITLIYRENKLDADHEAKLCELEHLHLFSLTDLHAKCYYNEKELVITSMNFYEHSELNNWEMGVLATSEEEVYQEAVDEVKSFLDEAQRYPLSSSSNGSRKEQKRGVLEILGFQANGQEEHRASGHEYATEDRGFCIRCRREIDYSPEAPYCRSCYRSWARWENPVYEEAYCHTCGQEEDTTFEKPQCYSCYQAQVTR